MHEIHRDVCTKYTGMYAHTACMVISGYKLPADNLSESFTAV
jgi:hypothetical protein